MAFTPEQIAAFPGWLQKLVTLTAEQRTAAGYTDEDLLQATKAYHLDADYTKKSQRAAALDKIQEQYPGLNLDDAAKVFEWWRQPGNGDQVTNFWPHRDRIQQILNAPAEPVHQPANGTKRRWQDAESADLYETARLREVLEGVEGSAYERAVKHVTEDWYEKKEKPRLDQVAGTYLATAIDLIEFSRDLRFKDLPLSDVMRAASSSGERDFRKAASKLLEDREGPRQAILEEGRKLGLEEAKRAAPASDGPSGPLGTGSPAWRAPAPTAKTQTKDEFRSAVLQAVEARHGQKLPL